MPGSLAKVLRSNPRRWILLLFYKGAHSTQKSRLTYLRSLSRVRVCTRSLGLQSLRIFLYSTLTPGEMRRRSPGQGKNGIWVGGMEQAKAWS